MSGDRRLMLVCLFVAAVPTVTLLLVSQAPSVTPQPTCMTADVREKARGIMMQGVEDALKQHTMQTFDMWLKDPSEQPLRASRGMFNGLSAYARARASVLNWSPPLCKEMPH